MTQANISRLERDKVSPSLQTLERLLEAMGETLRVSTAPLREAVPEGGNVTIAELRADFAELTPGQRIEQAALLSRAAGELAASRPES
jgi:transcriptional regulator with XRE-family HTH domain